MKKLASCIVASALAIGALAFAAPESAYAHGGGGPGGGHHGGGHHHKEKRQHKQHKDQRHYSNHKAQKGEINGKRKEAKQQQQRVDANRQQQAKAQKAKKERQQRAANEAALKKQKEAKALALKQQKEAEALALKKQREAEALALQEKQKQEALKQQKEAALKKKQEEKQKREALRLQKLAEKKNNHFPVIGEPKNPEWYEEVPEEYEGFLVSKVLNPKRNYWADEKYYLYVKQDQALALAELLEASPNGTLADYLGDVFLPFGNDESLNGITVPESSNIAPATDKLRALAAQGDVRITVFVKDQKVVIAKVSLWNGKYGFVKDSKKETVQYATLLDAQ